VIDCESLVKTRTNTCLSYASAVASYSVTKSKPFPQMEIFQFLEGNLVLSEWKQWFLFLSESSESVKIVKYESVNAIASFKLKENFVV
jgi:hypothetical protein